MLSLKMVQTFDKCMKALNCPCALLTCEIFVLVNLKCNGDDLPLYHSSIILKMYNFINKLLIENLTKQISK